MKTRLLWALASLLTLLAVATAGSATWWGFYQPSIPKSLERE
jgi:cyclic lactone autoinducer peptide